MDISQFSGEGLPLPSIPPNMAKLYGLGDFFHVMFEDTTLPNRLLEATTITASDIYSEFLQLTTSISLDTISSTIESQIRVLVLSSDDMFGSENTCVYLPGNVTQFKYLANRPWMPTEVLEDGVDFITESDVSGRVYVQFARPIHEYAISSRKLQNGATQYAIWAADVHIDERLMFKHFGRLVTSDPGESSQQFSDFVYGLFYMYTQGPTLGTITRGLNLVLGIPLARSTETVVDTREYLQTGQILVITSANQYVIPYGLTPSVEVGDTLRIGDSLAFWVEVKDYQSDGDWWVNLYIPKKLIPKAPAGQESRHATSGSPFDFLMRNYLKTHTFLLRIAISNFKVSQAFESLYSLARKIAPAYTQPIYVWASETTEDVSVADTLDQAVSTNYDGESCVVGGGDFRRDFGAEYTRRDNVFTRFCLGNRFKSLVSDTGQSVSAPSRSTLSISGIVALDCATRPLSEREAHVHAAIANRSTDTWLALRDVLRYGRGVSVITDDGRARVASVNAQTINTSETLQYTRIRSGSIPLSSVLQYIPAGALVIPVTALGQEELSAKLASIGLPDFPRYESFRVIKAPVKDLRDGGVVNSAAINSASYTLGTVTTWLQALANRTSALPAPYSANAHLAQQTDVSSVDATTNDTIVLIRVACNLVGVFFVTHNVTTAHTPAFFVEGDSDALTILTTSTPLRGHTPDRSGWHLTRGSTSQPPVTYDPETWGVGPELDTGTAAYFTYHDELNSTMPRLRGTDPSLNYAFQA